MSLLGAFGHCREGDKISVDKIVTEGEVVAEDDAVVVEEQVKKVPRDKCPCVYCGQKYGGLGGLKGHLYH